MELKVKQAYRKPEIVELSTASITLSPTYKGDNRFEAIQMMQQAGVGPS